MISLHTLFGPIVDLSALDRLSNMRNPQRSREARAVFEQLKAAGISRFQLRFGIRVTALNHTSGER